MPPARCITRIKTSLRTTPLTGRMWWTGSTMCSFDARTITATALPAFSICWSLPENYRACVTNTPGPMLLWPPPCPPCPARRASSWPGNTAVGALRRLPTSGRRASLPSASPGPITQRSYGCGGWKSGSIPRLTPWYLPWRVPMTIFMSSIGRRLCLRIRYTTSITAWIWSCLITTVKIAGWRMRTWRTPAPLRSSIPAPCVRPITPIY